MELLDLNTDCLLYLCHFLEAESIVAFSETCSILKSIAVDFFEFKKSYSCCIGSVEDEARAAKTIRKIGTHLTRMDLMFELEYQSSDRLFTLFASSLTGNLIQLSILGEICCMPLTILAPILQQLEILTVQNMCWTENCVLKIDLPALCPNLRELSVSGDVIFTPGETSFPQLESLDVDFAQKQAIAGLFRGNIQLKQLNLRKRRTINFILLSDLTMYLLNLEELNLDVGLIEKPIQDLVRIANFPRLHTLALYAIPATLFNDILKILETFNRLTAVTLQANLTRLNDQFLSSQESLVRVATELKQLQSFVTVNIDWTSEDVVKFVGEATKLEYFSFWSGSDTNYVVTPTFIRELASMRKASVYASIQPLKLEMFPMNHHLKQVNTVLKSDCLFNRFNGFRLVLFRSSMSQKLPSLLGYQNS